MLELVKCPVCWVSPRDAHQCPKCSKAFCYGCIKVSLTHNGKCPYCRSPTEVENLVRCPWLNDVCQMAAKAGESLRKCAVHQDKYMTHFDTIKKKPACELCVSEIPKSSLNKHNIRSLDEAAQEKEKNIHDEIKNIENETKNYWQNQLKMKTRISDFSQNQKDICHELRRNLDDQIKVLQQHMSATANALNEIKVLIPKKLASEVTDASKNKVFEFLTGEWADSSESQNDNDATFVLKIDDIRQLELETSPRHSKSMRVGDRDWYVDVGLLNQHRVGGWEGDDTEHLSVIIWQEESTRGTMSPPMSALIVAKDVSNDLLELVLFDKFNDLRGFGRRLFLSMDQLINNGTTKLEIEVLLGRRSPAFSLRLLRKMTRIAKEADIRMREVCSETKGVFQQANSKILEIIRQIRGNDLNLIATSLQLRIKEEHESSGEESQGLTTIPNSSLSRRLRTSTGSKRQFPRLNIRLQEDSDPAKSEATEELTSVELDERLERATTSSEPSIKRTRARRRRKV